MTHPFADDRLASVDPVIALVRQRVSGPMDTVIRDAIVRAAIQLCRGSAVVHYERAFGLVYEGQLLSFAQAASINRQARQTTTEPQVTGSVLHRIIQTDDAGTVSVLTPGEDYYALSPETIRFLVDAQNVTIVGAIEPLPGATQLPTILVESYADALADGATAILQLQPSRPWFNPDEGHLYQARFQERIRDAYRFRIEATPAARFDTDEPVRSHCFY